MSEQSRYDLVIESDRTMIRARTDRRQLNDLSNQLELFEDGLCRAVNRKTVIFSDTGDDILLDFDFKSAWRKKTDDSRWAAYNAARTVLFGVMAINANEEYELYDQYGYYVENGKKLTVSASTNRFSDGRLPMRAMVRWPEASDQQLSELTTLHMRSVARSIRYCHESPKRSWNSLIYGRIERERGVTLQTNPIGSCSIDTDGMTYEPEESMFELTAHNIYSPEQQIICLAGAIAIAQADILLAAQ